MALRQASSGLLQRLVAVEASSVLNVGCSSSGPAAANAVVLG